MAHIIILQSFHGHLAASLRTWCHHGVTPPWDPRAVHRPRVTLVVAQEANDTRLGAWKKCGESKGSALQTRRPRWNLFINSCGKKKVMFSKAWNQI